MFPEETEKSRKTRKVPKENRSLFTILMMKTQIKDIQKIKFCQYHSTCEYITDRCTTLKELVKLGKQAQSNQFDKKKRFTKLDFNAMVQKQVKKVLK